MRPSKVFIDTNVLLDYILDRGKPSIDAERIFEMCLHGEIECYIAAHSIVNIFYILRKYYSVTIRKQILSSLCALCCVVSVDERKVKDALEGPHSDVEDHIQILCAEEAKADCIITRNMKGFKNSSIKILTPRKFLVQ